MPGRRRTGLWVAGMLGLVAAVGLTALFVATGGRRRSPRAPVVFNERTSLAETARALREGDGRALMALYQKMTARPDASPSALGEAEAADWLDAMAGLRTGFLRFGGTGRVAALVVTTKILDRFAVEPAPSSWLKALPTAGDLIGSGLSDRDVSVRVEAMVVAGRTWGWVPGRTMLPVEDDFLAGWKQQLIAPVVRCLSDREPRARMAAVACLGALPLDRAGAPAIPGLEDPAGLVRKQVLQSFARRPGLLSTDAVIRRLYDEDPTIPPIAEAILKERGLSEEHIGFARMLCHPKPELRASLIPLIKDRTDIDPVVWLIQLSEDREESVRLAALSALAGLTSPEARGRVAAMAASDPSPAVRQAASRGEAPEAKTATLPLPLPLPRRDRPAAASKPEKTAALPPLPGSPSLNPKAN